jgi:nucleoside-triphosphatase THEP1
MTALRDSARRYKEESGPESPESLMISALVGTGQFVPAKYGLSVDDCESWTRVWRWCEQHQAETGEAPGIALLKTSWPEFVFTQDVKVVWAAKELGADSEKRRMLTAVRGALANLSNGEIEEAKISLAQAYISRPAGKPGDSVWQMEGIESVGSRWPVPYDSLGRVTGGIGSAELWYIAGASGAGKTMQLAYYVSQLLKEGARVHYLSLEVPTRVINKRVRRSLANREELKMLDALDADKNPDREKIIKAIAQQRKRVDGELMVFDPSHGRVTPSVVRHHMHECDIVVVDHVGLMYAPDGRRAIDDWRALATISNCLMEDKLATGTSVLAAAQLNKEGSDAGEKPPKLTTVGGAYQLVQDADVIVTIKRLSNKVLVHGSEKNRDGDNAVWYSKFDVKNADFRQCTYDQAQEQMGIDEDQHHLR